MKPQIHPNWYPEAQVTCACGEVWTIGATTAKLHTDVCSKCHPYFTGEQRIVDTEGQVDRFMRRLQAREEAIKLVELRKSARVSPEVPIDTLDLGRRMEKVLADAGIEKIGDLLTLMEEQGDDGLTNIKGLGLKGLADLKKGLRARGYILPGDEAGEDVAIAA
jgi:large subunit ribosomal protein L31